MPCTRSLQGTAGHRPPSHPATPTIRNADLVSAVPDSGCRHYITTGDVADGKEEEEVRRRREGKGGGGGGGEEAREVWNEKIYMAVHWFS